DERWATDLCRVWGGHDGWLVLALVIDCYTRQLLGWQLSRSGKATTAAAALDAPSSLPRLPPPETPLPLPHFPAAATSLPADL
ncbi:hypothetical protein NM961_22430, partial [Tahibacter sp. P2K]|nr:hypothetical protein [Tahibacter harae]